MIIKYCILCEEAREAPEMHAKEKSTRLYNGDTFDFAIYSFASFLLFHFAWVLIFLVVRVLLCCVGKIGHGLHVKLLHGA